MKEIILTDEILISESGLIHWPRTLIENAAKVFAGKRVVVTIQRWAEQRTKDQNAYYWVAIVDPLTDKFNELGERLLPGDVHEILKWKNLRVSIADPETADVKLEYSKSTASLKVHQFAFYLDDCIRFAAEYAGLVVDPPKRSSKKYQFKEFPRNGESERSYHARIKKYVNEIESRENLKRYFELNDHWKESSEIRAIFNARNKELLTAGQ